MNVTWQRRVGWCAVAGAVAFIGYATLRPEGTQVEHFEWCLLCGGDDTADAIRNVVLFIPLGFLLPLIVPKKRAAFALAVAFTVTIEILQQWLPGRDPGIGDMLTNSVGAALGIAAFSSRRGWVRPSGWFALGAAAVAVSVWVVGGLMLQPSFRTGEQIALLAPDTAATVRYRAPVFWASLGAGQITDSMALDPGVLMGALDRGEVLRVRAIAVPPTDGLAELFSIRDTLRGDGDTFILGPDRGVLRLGYRVRGSDWGLDQANFPLPGVPPGTAGDTVQVALWRAARSFCIGVDAVQRCGFGYAIGDERTLLWFAPWESLVRRRLLGLIWVALLVAPVGFWLAPDAGSVAAVGLTGAALAGVPQVTGLISTPLAQWITAGAALAVGLLLRRALSRVTPESG
jgi:hypothetical protein